MAKTLHIRDINSAADLLTFLSDLRDDGMDLSVMWVNDAVGVEFEVATVCQHKLTDGSYTYDLVLSFDEE